MELLGNEVDVLIFFRPADIFSVKNSKGIAEKTAIIKLQHRVKKFPLMVYLHTYCLIMQIQNRKKHPVSR